jgi:hypothetical protein
MTRPLLWVLPIALGLAAASARAQSVPTGPAAAPEPPASHETRVVALLGTTAVATNNVLFAPVALGLGVLVEHRWLGIEGAVHVDGATVCDMPCGQLRIFDVAPRATLLPGASWSPYLSARFQIAVSEPHGVVPALGPRAGVRYRGARVGFYLEGGPSFVSSRESEIGGFAASGRAWFPQVSTGITLTLR